MAEEEDTSVDVGDGGEGGYDSGDVVAGLLRMSDNRLYKGEHHDGTTPMPILKGDSDEVEPSSVPEEDNMYTAFSTAGALEPPLPPDFFVEALRISNILRQNIEAYATNIDGFGHHFDTVIDFDSDDALHLVEHKLRQELGPEQMDETGMEGLIENRIKRYKGEATFENIMLDSFFKYAAHGTSFVKLRRLTRGDLELIGWGGWEVLRNKRGEVAKFKRVPAYTLRLMPADLHPTRIIEQQRRGAPWNMEEVPVWYNFRRFVHYQGGARRGGQVVYFKDFLDPRVVSRETGRYYETVQELTFGEGDHAKPANELIYFCIDSMDSPYGEPRWIGNLLSVLGSRSSEEVNFLFFRNKSIPPLVLTISGGKFKKGDADAIEKKIEKKLHGGPKKFHKIFVITASTDPQSTTQPKIEFKPLTDAIFKDALFQNYDDANRNKVSESFLIPPLLRGVTKDFNRATAQAALQFAEGQVFQGQRSDFDWLMNYRVMPALVIDGEPVKYHEFVSNGPPLRDPETVVSMVEKLVKANVMVPAEARRELASVGFKMERIDEAWTKRPVQITALGVGFEPEEGERVVDEATTDTFDPDAPDKPPEDGALQSMEEQLAGNVKPAKVGGKKIQGLNQSAVRAEQEDTPHKT